jgi:hypothetical protein
MLLIVFKLWLGGMMATIGLWFWRLAKKWSEQGEIPKEWVESVKSRPWFRADRGFGAMIAWQRAIAIMFWFFSGLIGLSIVSHVIELLQ